VTQLHSAFLRFHNSLTKENYDMPFREVQRLVRWHYQWIVLHDFLPTIVGWEMLHRILPHLKSGGTIFDHKPEFRIYHWRNEPYIPVEFSVGAYRFGHSMVRPVYRLNLSTGTDKEPGVVQSLE